MGFFSKLFGKTNQETVSVSVESSLSWHYTGEGDCPDPVGMDPVKIPGISCPDAVGYFNLARYNVSGHIINPKTNRSNVKRMVIDAVDLNDARAVATDNGLLEPLTIEVSKANDIPPNEYQIANAKEYGIKIPNGATDGDVRAMVSRGPKEPGPSPELALFCTKKRFLFSRFIGEHDLLMSLVHSQKEINSRDRLALFACAVDCAQSGRRLGNPDANQKYYEFADSVSESVKKQIEERGIQDLPVPRKGTNAWNAVVKFLSS